MKNIRDMSILNKFTIAYILLVFSPVLFISSFSYCQTKKFYEKELIEESNKYLSYLKNSITQRLDIIKETGRNLAYNPQISSFLKRKFSFDQFGYKIYREDIYSIVNNTMIYDKQNMHIIRIFFRNKTIPEGWGYFYSEKRLYEKEWYKDFIRSDDLEVCLRLNCSKYFEHINLNNAKDMDGFIFFRKILDYNGTIMGTLAIEIFDKDILQPFFDLVSEEKYGFFILYQNKLLYASYEVNDYPSIDQIIRNLNLRQGYYKDDENIIVYDTINELGIKLGTVTSTVGIKRIISSLNMNIVLVNIAALILIIAFYIFIQIFFYNVRKNMETMTKVIQGDFSVRIPVKRRNEIGIIAEYFNFMIEKVNELIHEMIKKETAQKEAQLNALQYQINPHFIYNTLDIISGKMFLSGNYDVAEEIAKFGKMLRYNLSSNSKFSTIWEESEHIRNYISLQRLRYGDNIKLSINLQDELKNCRILKFILQPIVENSVIHGFIDKNTALEIIIDFMLKNSNTIEIVVTDTGRGIPEKELKRMNQSFEKSEYSEWQQNKNGSIGLININERLKLFYGKEHFIKLESEEGKYTKVRLIIPNIREEG